VAKIVLVADDHPAIRKQLCALFEHEADYELCEQATNGQEAVELASRHKPDLIILDFAMPVMNGIEAAKQIKKFLPKVPIILFTMHDQLVLVHARPFDRFIDRIVSKADMSHLLSHVRELAPV
jgi:DNA-binding NarL/FixJ family response regulator